MEITFLTKRSDLASYYDYFIKNTTEGKKYASALFSQHLTLIVFSFFLLYLLAATLDNPNGVKFSLGLLLITLLVYFGYNRLNPKLYAAKRRLLVEQKKYPLSYWQILERKRKAKISTEWLEIITADSISRFHWNMVDSVAVRSDYIFLIIGGSYIIPRRDFPTEENYQEFGKSLMEYWKGGKNKPISVDLIPNSL